MAAAKRRCVWVVDDSALEAERARACLASRYDVVVLRDGSEAVEQLDVRVTPDLIVIDWVMPGMTGIDVCRYLRDAPGSSPLQRVGILLLTVNQQTEQIVEALAAGANDFLSKPYAEAELLARVGALLRSRELLERAEHAEATVMSLLENTPDALLSIDASHTVSFANAQAAQTFRRPVNEIVGQRLASLVAGLDLPPPSTPLLARHTPVPLADVVVGDRTYAPTTRPLADGDVATIVSLRDVTDQRQLESRRLDFYSIIAHDLRSPLHALALRNEMMSQMATSIGAEEIVAGLRKTHRNIASLVALINDFLEIAVLDGSAHLSAHDRVDMNVVVQQSIDVLEPLATGKRVRIVTSGDEPAAEVLGNHRRLGQVVTNLVSNAIKFTAPESTVFVAVERDADCIATTVRDRGRGIAADVLPTLFQRYSRSSVGHPDVEGSGLGLLIVREIVESFGGTVGAVSELGQGSTFAFRLPAAPPTA